MTLYNLLTKAKIVFDESAEDCEITNIQINPDSCSDSSLLVIPNSNKIPAIQEGAPYRVLCGYDAEIPKVKAVIRVDNPRVAVANLYSAFENIDYSLMKFVGITGTNGKTSTATFVRQAAESAGIKVGFIGTGSIYIDGERISDDFYSMTTPDPWILYPAIKKMELAGVEAVIMEVSSHALELHKVEPIEFDVGVFTNLSMEHMDFHGDMESYYLAKKKLFAKCRLAIINIDDYYGRRLVKEISIPKITAGILWRGDAYVSSIENRGFDGLSFLYHGRGFTFIARLKAAGIYNIYNSMLAITVCTKLGIRPCEIKKALSESRGVLGRYEIIKDKITVIIDYAHTDFALENVLKSLSSTKKASQRVTLVFGCGGERDRSKRARMASVAEKYADIIIVTSDNSRSEPTESIISDIRKGFVTADYRIIEDRAEAIKSALAECQDGDIVAIIGKGDERYTIDSQGYHYFNEREIIKDALSARRSSK